MRRTDVFQIRIEPELRDRLARLRDQRHVNPGAWARDVIAAALDLELLADLETPNKQPLAGWRPCNLGEGWGAVLDGPGVAALAEDPRPAPISITDSRRGSSAATITEVVSLNPSVPGARSQPTQCVHIAVWRGEVASPFEPPRPRA